MKRQRVRIVTAIVAVAGIAGCFSDPTSSLRNGPAQLRLSRTAVVVPVSDSVLVEANVVDAQGNILPADDAVWTSDNATVADVALAATQLPAAGSSRAYIRGVATLGGITTVRVTVRGVTDSVRVVALPTRFFSAGTFTVTGTPTPDTTSLGVTAGCAGANAGQCFTAGDTLTITAPAGLVFDASSSVVTLGGLGTLLLSRSATAIKVMANRGHIGPVTVSNVTWLGNATTGDILVASLDTPDDVTISRARMRGAVTVGNSVLGANTEMVISAGPNTTFNTAAPLSAVVFGGVPATVLARTANSITVIATAPYTGGVKVTNVNVTQGAGSVLVDSLSSGANSTIAGGYFPGTAANNLSRLLDTIVVNGGGVVTFGATSNISINGSAAFMISRTANELRAIAQVAGLDDVTITNVVGPVWTYASLNTSGLLTVNSQITGEANEPGNDGPGGATVITAPVNVNDTVFVYGAVRTGTDIDDYFTFTTGAAGQYRVVVDWLPTGIDVDVFTLNGAGGGFCVLDGCGAATGADPEVSNSTLGAATNYKILINLYDAHNLPTPIPYRVRVIRRT